MKLQNIVNAWGETDFAHIAKKEIESIDSTHLPLQQGLSLSSYVSDNPFSITVLKTTENDNSIIIKTGIFFSGIIAGCSCADDPTPLDEQNEYCEIQFTINKNTAETRISLLTE